MPVINKFDTRTKFISVLILVVLVFLVDRLMVAFCLLLLFLIIRQAARIPVNIKSYKNLTLLAAFIILMQALFGPGEKFIVMPLFPESFPFIGGIGSIKWEGLILGLLVVCRFYSLFIIFSIFSATTSPYSLAVGLNSLGFSYTGAFVITKTFNLIPLFKEEAEMIMDAQKLRGMRSLEKGSVFSRLKAYSMLTLPLVLSAMRKAQISSVVMDSRAFGAYKKRTWLDKPEMKKRDYFFLFACVVFTAAVLSWNYLLR